MLYSAIVTDKETKEKIIITSDYNNKSAFIKDLRLNGYSVNQYKVKTKNVFNYIMNNTNASTYDWKTINREEDINAQ